MIVKKKKGRGIWDSIISGIFSETSKKIAASAAEAAVKTAATKGSENLVNALIPDEKPKTLTPPPPVLQQIEYVPLPPTPIPKF